MIYFRSSFPADTSFLLQSTTCYNDEDENIERIIFHVPAVYSDKVKIHDWYYNLLIFIRINRKRNKYSIIKTFTDTSEIIYAKLSVLYYLLNYIFIEK